MALQRSRGASEMRHKKNWIESVLGIDISGNQSEKYPFSPTFTRDYFQPLKPSRRRDIEEERSRLRNSFPDTQGQECIRRTDRRSCVVCFSLLYCCCLRHSSDNTAETLRYKIKEYNFYLLVVSFCLFEKVWTVLFGLSDPILLVCKALPYERDQHVSKIWCSVIDFGLKWW